MPISKSDKIGHTLAAFSIALTLIGTISGYYGSRKASEDHHDKWRKEHGLNQSQLDAARGDAEIFIEDLYTHLFR